MNKHEKKILQALYEEGTKFRDKEKRTKGMKKRSFPLIVEELGNSKSLDDYTREVKGDNLYFDAKTEPIFIYNPRAGRVRLVQNGREKKSWIDVNLSLVSGYHEIKPEKESSEAAAKPQENTVMGNTLLTGRLNFDPRIHKEQALYERKAYLIFTQVLKRALSDE